MVRMQFTPPVSIKTVRVSTSPKKTVYYPKVHNIENQALQRFVNGKIAQQTQQLIDQQVANMPSTVEEMLGEFEIKNNQRQVLSLSLSNYTYHQHAAHGMTYIKSLTFDLKQGKLCELKDLFKPGSNYVKRLTSIIAEQIEERNIQLLDEFTKIQPNQDFYIADKILVIYFQLYEITHNVCFYIARMER